MKAIIAGHRYQLVQFEGTLPMQELQFIHKEPAGLGTPELKTVTDGTTNEEVLAVLVDRLKFLSDKVPCRETAIAITKLEEASMWLQKRTAERKARNVEGTNQA